VIPVGVPHSGQYHGGGLLKGDFFGVTRPEKDPHRMVFQFIGRRKLFTDHFTDSFETGDLEPFGHVDHGGTAGEHLAGGNFLHN